MEQEKIAQLDLVARTVHLDIPAEYRAGVSSQFDRLAAMAEQVMSFPLSDPDEPAAVLRLD